LKNIIKRFRLDVKNFASEASGIIKENDEGVVDKVSD
jgi:hypothetical protein